MKTQHQIALDLKLTAEMYMDGLALKRAQLHRQNPLATPGTTSAARRMRETFVP